MASLDFECKLLDSGAPATPGRLTVGSAQIEFRPHAPAGAAGAADHNLAFTLRPADLRCATFAEIGKRGDKGALIEVSFYTTDVTRVHTVTDIPAAQSGALRTLLVDEFSVEVIGRRYQSKGWNWGRLLVNSAALSFTLPTDTLSAGRASGAGTGARASASAAGDRAEGRAANEGEGEGEDEDDTADDLDETPVEAEVFHIASASVVDHKVLNTKDINIVMRSHPAVPGRKMWLKELTFGCPDHTTQLSLYTALSRVVDLSSSDRIVSVPDVTAFTTKSIKFTVEILHNALRFFSASQDHRVRGSDIARIFFLEKFNDRDQGGEFFLVLFFAPGKGLSKDTGSCCLALTQKRLTRELNLGCLDGDAEALDHLQRCMSLSRGAHGAGAGGAGDTDEPFWGADRLPPGTASLITMGVAHDKVQPMLNSVPVCLALPHLVSFLAPARTIVFSEQSLEDYAAVGSPIRYRSIRLHNQSSDYAFVSYCECRYKKNRQKAMYLYFLDPRAGILVAPYAAEFIPYREVRQVNIDSDPARETRVRLTVTTTGGSYEFTEVHKDYVDAIEQYLTAEAQVRVRVSLLANRKVEAFGGGAGEGGAGDVSGYDADYNSEDDADFQVGNADASSSESSSGSQNRVGTDGSSAGPSEEDLIEQKRRTRMAGRNGVDFRPYEDVRPQDAFREVRLPQMWAGK